MPKETFFFFFLMFEFLNTKIYVVFLIYIPIRVSLEIKEFISRNEKKINQWMISTLRVTIIYIRIFYSRSEGIENFTIDMDEGTHLKQKKTSKINNNS